MDAGTIRRLVTRRSRMRAIGMMVAGALVAASLGSAQAAEPLVIGMFGPMTGERSALGLRFREAADMFIGEINAKGGIGGRMLEVRVEDTRGNPKDADLP